MEKAHVDIAQVILTDDSLLGFLGWLLVAVMLLQVLKLASNIGSVISWVWRNRSTVLLRPSWPTFILVFAIAIFAWMFRYQLNDQIQYIEQVYLRPVYMNNDTSYWALSMYETELKRHVSESEFQLVKQETEHLAYDLQSSPLAMYEVCYSECGLDPFACNVDDRTGDTVAVGWIQFTRAGIKQVFVQGQQITWPQVKSWVKSRNLLAMMEATRSYMTGRANGRTLATSTDIYIAVFAPAFVGYGDDKTLYSISSWPAAYYDNKGLDGYALINGKIVKGAAFMDGKITVQDMRLHLAMKKSKFLNQ